MRPDSHDAVAVVGTLRGASQPAEENRRRIVFGEVSESKVSVPRSRSPSPAPTLGAEFSVVEVDYDGDASDETEDEVSRLAQELHSEMREFWNERYDGEYDQKLLHHLSTLQFKKRKCAQAADMECDTAYASQAETVRAIMSAPGSPAVSQEQRHRRLATRPHRA